MKCEFCQGELSHSHHENNKQTQVYECLECPLLIQFHYDLSTMERIKTCYLIDRSNRLYLWTNNYLEKSSHIVDLGVTLYDLKYNSATIVSFPQIVKLSPLTISQKLASYLLFI